MVSIYIDAKFSFCTIDFSDYFGFTNYLPFLLAMFTQ